MKTRAVGLMVLCTCLLAPGLGYAFLAEGDHAPEFAVEALDHSTIGLSDHSNSIVVLFLLTTSNSRCSDAAPAYEQNVYQAYRGKHVVVLGIDVDPANETFDDLAQFRDEHGITFPLAMDTNGECWDKYKGDESGNVPVFYVIDPSRTIRTIRLGYRSGREQYIIEAIEAILFEMRPTLSLSLNREVGDMTPYQPEDTMRLYASVENGTFEASVIAYVAVGVKGELFFWPSYSKVPHGLSLTLPSGFAVDNLLVEQVTFNDSFWPGIYTWYAAFADGTTGELLGDVARVSWPFGHHDEDPLDRSSLEVPDDLWDYVLSNVGYEGQTLGYREDEMVQANYYGHEFRLRRGWEAFRDVPGLVDFSGEVGDALLQSRMTPRPSPPTASICLSSRNRSRRPTQPQTAAPLTKPALWPGRILCSTRLRTALTGTDCRRRFGTSSRCLSM